MAKFKVILIFCVFLGPISALTASVNTSEHFGRTEKRIPGVKGFVDAWEVALQVLDSCINFGNPSNSSANIYFYSEGAYSGEITIGGDIPSSFVPNAPLKIIIHGLTSSHTAFKGFHGAYKSWPSDVNVILVDWSKDAESMIKYCHAAQETERVGYMIAQLLVYLIDINVVTREDVHVIGHSLGAQAAGFAGKYFQSLTSTQFYRITGLDPAYPGFRYNSQKLSKDDASVVDVVHSNGIVEDRFQHSNGHFHLGFSDPLGHYDFYPNGGFNQPGCDTGAFTLPCNHERAVQLFAESIYAVSTKPFYSKQCGSYEAFIGRTLEGCGEPSFNYLGENLMKDAPHGNYYFCTAEAQPFDKGEVSGLQCKPTVCDMYRRSGVQSKTSLSGFQVTLSSIQYSEEILPNEKEFVGIDEIKNQSPATVTQIVSHHKKTWEKTETTSDKYWGTIAQFCASHAWGDSNHCHKLIDGCGSTGPLTVRTETESEFSLTREVIVPPFTNIHICSTVSVSKETAVQFEATARYTAEGLWAEEIARILAEQGIDGVIDKSEGQEAVLVQVSGSVKVSLALEPQFVVSDLAENGQSTCTSISELIREIANAKLNKRIDPFEIDRMKERLDKLILHGSNYTSADLNSSL